MDTEHLQTPSTFPVFLHPRDEQANALRAGAVRISSSDGHSFLLQQGNTHCEALLTEAPQNQKLTHAWQSKQYLLAHLKQSPISELDLELNVTPFVSESRCPDILYVKLSGELPKKLLENGSREQAASRLKDDLFLTIEGRRYLCIQPYQSRDKYAGGLDDQSATDDIGLQRFSIVSNHYTVRVCLKEASGIPYYEAYRCRPVAGFPHGLTYLQEVKDLVFSDKTDGLSTIVRASLDRLNARHEGYLKQWEKYRNKAGDMALAKGRKFLAKIQSYECNGEDYQLNLPLSVQQGMEAGAEVCVWSQLPAYLMDEHITKGWAELCIDCGEPDSNQQCILRGRIQKIQGQGDQVAVFLRSETIQEKESWPEQTWLSTDISMDLTQLQRQRKAYDAIYNGHSANCFLAHLIEEDSDYAARPLRQRIPAESPFVHQKLFKGRELTTTQKEAVELALNTPDIVLIQGPPGTGKTTVVTAILERLNELQDKSAPQAGDVLVTSFQHDAVENIIERLSINSLPTIKFGKKRTEEEDMHSAYFIDKLVGSWAEDVATKLKEKHPFLAEQLPGQELHRLRQSYTLAPGPEAAVRLLHCVLAQPHSPAPALEERIRDLLSKLHHHETKNHAEILSAVYSLRTDERAWSDDGRNRMRELRRRLEESQKDDWDSEVDSLLQKLKYAETKTAFTPVFQRELVALKQDCLRHYIPEAQFRRAKPNAEVLALVQEFEEQCMAEENGYEGGMDSVVREFYSTLVNNPDSIRDAIESYNFVYAATNQQTLGIDIITRKLRAAQKVDGSVVRQTCDKERGGFIPPLFYSTVIVDEAAKSAPPDLMIPMALAKNRIILVGDHRQLPHMIDEEICKELESDHALNVTESIRSALQESMFEHMKKRLEALEKKDGIKRTITLDRQYRTHSVLGNLVSKYFYDSHGEGYTSPLAADKFVHNLPNTGNAPCVWVDVSREQGTCARDAAASLYRQAEAFRVAQLLKQWMDSDEGAKLTFGVITFYKAQQRKIWEELGKNGMTASGGMLKEEYRFIEKQGNKQERLRIGTVDSFQGMEFDVVILSAVRCADSDFSKKPYPFGFLENPNRLCVALSRQKKLLAIVGDSALVDNDICRNRKDTVAILSEFFSLCQQYKTVLK